MASGSTKSMYDVVIVGGGVASVECARRLLEQGLTVRLIDKGSMDRDPEKPHDLANGIMGAGTFSDGKYSFFPAGTKIWELTDKASILRGLRAGIGELNAAHEATKAEVAASPAPVEAHYPPPRSCSPRRVSEWKLALVLVLLSIVVKDAIDLGPLWVFVACALVSVAFFPANAPILRKELHRPDVWKFAGSSLLACVGMGAFLFDTPFMTVVWRMLTIMVTWTGLDYFGVGQNYDEDDDKDEVMEEEEEVPSLLDTETLVRQVEEHFCALEQHRAEPSVLADTADDAWKFKAYTSIYVPLAARLKLVRDASQLLAPHALMEHVVHNITRSDIDGIYEVAYQRNGNFHETLFCQARAIVVAGGRFAPMFLKLPASCERVFQRIEIGVRLSARSDNPAWKRMKGTDPKFINNPEASTINKELSWRSFCCCRDGKTALSSFQGLVTYSGRADCPKTGRTNTGFNVRCHDPALMGEFHRVVREMRLRKPQEQPFAMSLDAFLNDDKADKDQVIGSVFSVALRKGLREFLHLFPELVQDVSARIEGPCVEGVGEYWCVDENLMVPNHNIWVAGDSCGVARGLVPAMIGGAYIAEKIIERMPTICTEAEQAAREHANAPVMVSRPPSPNTKGVILNQILDDVSYSHTYPHLKGKNGTQALHEVHIFLGPANPDADTVKRYVARCAEWNELHKEDENFKPMKSPFLALECRKADGSVGEDGYPATETVRLMQSARYITSNKTSYVVEQCHADAKWFADAGFTVIREKIESGVYGIDGVPQNKEEMRRDAPTKYFETHLRVELQAGADKPLGDAELAHLKRLSHEFSLKFGVPVPLSWNETKSIDGVHQRFLNLRGRDMGAPEMLARVQQLREAIRRETPFLIGKEISEFVLWDSNTAIDNLWIDWGANEVAAAAVAR